MNLRPGVCIDVWEGGEVFSMLYVGDDKGKLKVVSSKGREMRVPPARVANVTEHTLDPAGDRVVLGERLREWESQLRVRAETVDLESLWEILTDEGGQYELDELTELAFGTRGGDLRAVVLRQLLADTGYFLRKQLSFSPRTRDEHDRSVERKRAEETLADQRDGFLTKARFRPDNSGVRPPWSESDRRFLAVLRDVAVHGVASKQLREGQGLLNDLGFGGRTEPELAAFDLLFELGVLRRDENLFLERYGVVREFAPEVLTAAATLRVAGPCINPGRRDLTGLECFTVDDGQTTEVDDALSIEELEGGRVRVGIHIADPSPYVPAGSLMDGVARDRSTTFYLPEGRILMLPSAISEDLASLIEGQVRTALTFLVELEETGEVRGTEIVESAIRVTRRLDYEQTDALIALGEAALSGAQPPATSSVDPRVPAGLGPEVARRMALAARLAQRMLDRRAAAGALILKGPDLDLKVVDGKILIRRIEPWTASWTLVSEMMVLANWLAAKTLRNANRNAIYRRQTAPDQPIELPRTYDPAAAAAARRRIKPTELSIHPGPHAGLGLDVYVQCTSPLRRYQDLVGHRLLKAALAGGPSLSDEALWAVIASCGEIERSAREMERNCREYWLLRHLESLPPDTAFGAVVTRPDERRTLIELDDFAHVCQLQPRQGHKPGRAVRVVVDAVNPRAGRLVLREV